MPHAVVVIRGALAVVVVLVSLTACGGAPAPAPTVTVTVTAPPPAAPSSALPTGTDGDACEIADEDVTDLTKAELDKIREGANYSAELIDRGISIPLSEFTQDGHGYSRVLVVDVAGDSAVLLAGDDLAPILAIDQIARDAFTWGEAAKPGSEIGDYRDQVADSDLVSMAAACLSN